MVTDSDPTEWITTKEASELTGYHDTHITWLVREGRVEGRKFGRDWMVDKESLLEYADQMRQLGSARHDPRGAAVRLKEEMS
jgi:excisionase family DNA binding protein